MAIPGNLILTGIYFSSHNNSMEYYFAGSQLFQGWIIGLSLVV